MYLFKVRKYLDIITPKLESDEAMIPFKGNPLKDKPTKWGIKVFVLSDATNGYVCQLQVYTGKTGELSSSEQGLSTKVVHELVRGKESVQPRSTWTTTTLHHSCFCPSMIRM